MLARINSRQPGSQRRSAFTFIELMAVLVIALIIIALSATASIQVLAYQRSHTTQTVLKALSDSLDRQWAAVIDAAKREPIPADVYSLAGAPGSQNIEARARVIWIKLRLKQEFPMNFSEALYPAALPPSLGAQPISSIQARPTYFRILRNAGYYVPAVGESQSAALTIPASVRPVCPFPPPPPRQFWFDPATWPEESSICLLMSLQQARSGFALTEDDLGSGALMTDPISGLKMIVDAWQQPVYFYRWQTPPSYSVDQNDPGNQNNREVDNSSPVGPLTTQPNTFFRDPLDPEGTLLDATWNNYQNYQAQQGVWWFELYCHPVHEDVAPTPGAVPYSVRSYYTIPVLVSGGRNGRRGLMQVGSQTNPKPPPLVTIPTFIPYLPQFQGQPAIPPGLFPSPLLPDLMDLDPGDLPGNPEGANDNIYSHRLRQGTRGD